MSKKVENKQDARNTMSTFAPNTFTSDNLLSDVESVVSEIGGNDVIEYKLRLVGKGDTEDYILTDLTAIEAIKGIQAADKLEKYATYRKGAYLVQLIDSPFMKDNELKSVSALAAKYELGVETSTANALESVARKLGVTFDENGTMSFADSELPMLSFWHYSQVISLVTQDEHGNFDYTCLKEFFRLAHVSPIMSQKTLKERFNDYRNGRMEGATAKLPDSVTEKAKKDAERIAQAEKEKQERENAKKIVSASIALEKAESFENKQAVALSALDALAECMGAIGISTAATFFDDIREMIVDAKEAVTE